MYLIFIFETWQNICSLKEMDVFQIAEVELNEITLNR